MAVNAAKIRVGAPDLMMLDATTASPVDIGASTGGAVLQYNATYFPVEIDQTILAATAYKTKEEILFSVTLVQQQASTLVAAMSLQSSVKTTTASGTMAAMTPAPTVTNNGTPASTTYVYDVVPFNYNGDGVPVDSASFTTGPATLTSVNSLTITWTEVPPGATGVKIVRKTGGASQGLIATLFSFAVPGSFIDTGLVATAYVAATAQPATPNIDMVTFGGDLSVPTHTFDWAVPKNDGTQNHWLGHLYKCYSGKAISIDWMKTKQADLTKFELSCLADTTRAVGAQAGYVAELY